MTPSHPGETLADWLAEQDLNLKRFSELSDINLADLHRVLQGQQAIDEKMARRLAIAGCSTADFWLNRQAFYEHDLEVGRYVSEGVRRIGEFFPDLGLSFETKIDGDIYTKVIVYIDLSVDEAMDRLDKFDESWEPPVEMFGKILFNVEFVHPLSDRSDDEIDPKEWPRLEAAIDQLPDVEEPPGNDPETFI